MKKVKIAFVGGGNMGEALIAALIKKRLWSSSQIGLFDSDQTRLKKLKKRYRIVSFSSNTDLAKSASILLLAVKPQQMGEVLQELSPHITRNHLILSIAAGLDTSYFQKRLPEGTRFIRIMPNLCVMIGEGASGLYASPTAKSVDRKLALQIFSIVGKAIIIDDEKLLDAVTALSGSGPAFVFSFLQALILAGEKQGLPPSLCQTLAFQTFLGAVKMAEKTTEPLSDLIQKVTSKGGTTETGLKVLQERGLSQMVEETIVAATKRAEELRQCTS